jgi:hypothetical protein
MALTVRMPDDLVWAVRDMGGEVERTGERA